MKKRRLYKMTSVLLALLLLVSCAPQDVGNTSSAMPQNENESSIVSSVTSKEETSSLSTTSDRENVVSKKPETQSAISSNSSQKTEVNSKSPDTSSNKPESTTTSNTTKEETSSNESEKLDPKYIKYVMLPNNPAPVKVNREDAAVPTHISYTDTLQDGDAISFEAQSIADHGYMTAIYDKKLDRCIAIADSYEEYKSLFKDEYNKYNQQYFESNALIVLYIIDPCFDAKQEIKSVTQKDNQMCVHLKNIKQGGGYMFDYACMFVEISKDDLININDIVVYEEKICKETSQGEIYYLLEYIVREGIHV